MADIETVARPQKKTSYAAEVLEAVKALGAKEALSVRQPGVSPQHVRTNLGLYCRSRGVRLTTRVDGDSLIVWLRSDPTEIKGMAEAENGV